MTKNKSTIEELIKNQLAQHLGISDEDIDNDDDLKIDLHMNAAEISDFMQSLKNIGLSVDLSKISSTETVSELVETITEEEEF
jgi:hypothetical protein